MKNWKVHYINKYPGCAVKKSESSFDVYSSKSEHLISMAKDGSGQWVDRSAEEGCSERHDLSPIPRDCRVFKLDRDGNIVRDEEANEREAVRTAVAKKHDGKIPSIAELAAAKHKQAGRPGEFDPRSLEPKAKYNYADVAPEAPKASAKA